MIFRPALVASLCLLPSFVAAQLAAPPQVAPDPAQSVAAPPAQAAPVAPGAPATEPSLALPAAPPQPQPEPEAPPAAPAADVPPPSVAPAPTVPVPAAPPATVAPAPARDSGTVDPRAVYTPRYTPAQGFQLRTLDGDFSLAIRARLQMRYQMDAPDVGLARHYVELHRARIGLFGNVWGPHTRYALELGFAPSEVERAPAAVSGMPSDQDVVQNSPLLDAYVDFQQLRDLNLRVGQMKVPFSRERMTEFSDLLFVDRALTDNTFGMGRDIGIDLHSDDLFGLDLLRYHAAIYGGEGPNTSPATIGAGDHGFLYDARLELLPMGCFDDYSEPDYGRNDKPHLSIGVGYALLQADATSPLAQRYLGRQLGGAGTMAMVDFNAHNFTADAMFKLAGFSAFSAFHYRATHGVAGSNFDGIGWRIGAGYLLPDVPLEFAAAYALVRDNGGLSSLPRANELQFGLSYFLARNMLALQADYARLWGATGLANGSDRVRVQLQVVL